MYFFRLGDPIPSVLSFLTPPDTKLFKCLLQHIYTLNPLVSQVDWCVISHNPPVRYSNRVTYWSEASVCTALNTVWHFNMCSSGILCSLHFLLSASSFWCHAPYFLKLCKPCASTNANFLFKVTAVSVEATLLGDRGTGPKIEAISVRCQASHLHFPVGQRYWSKKQPQW